MTIPLFLQQKRSIITLASHRIYDWNEKAFIREQIQGISRDLTPLDTDLIFTHFQIINGVYKDDYDGIDRTISLTMESDLQEVQRDKKQKLEKLKLQKENYFQVGFRMRSNAFIR